MKNLVIERGPNLLWRRISSQYCQFFVYISHTDPFPEELTIRNQKTGNEISIL